MTRDRAVQRLGADRDATVEIRHDQEVVATGRSGSTAAPNLWRWSSPPASGVSNL